MLRYARKYSSRPRANSALVGLLVALALLALAALKSWWDGPTRPPNRFPPPPAGESAPQSVAARVLKVVDGDTFDARIEIRPGFRVTARVRLRGIDAPELHAACEEERIGAEAAQRALRAILAEGEVTIRDVGEDKYGRLLGTASTRATPNVAEALIAKGVARRYNGGHRAGWC
jgi:endonuclease YncB( thermonuclease family)